jgi:mutator protein MutT
MPVPQAAGQRPTVQRIPCAGAVVKDQAGRLLLVKRRHEPGAGLWSLPGGRIEPGETAEQAMVREVREETGLLVSAIRLLGVVERHGRAGSVAVISDFLAAVTGGSLAAGDDAADARWVTGPELGSLEMTDGLTGTLARWGVLPCWPEGTKHPGAGRGTGGRIVS